MNWNSCLFKDTGHAAGTQNQLDWQSGGRPLHDPWGEDVITGRDDYALKAPLGHSNSAAAEQREVRTVTPSSDQPLNIHRQRQERGGSVAHADGNHDGITGEHANLFCVRSPDGLHYIRSHPTGRAQVFKINHVECPR